MWVNFEDNPEQKWDVRRKLPLEMLVVCPKRSRSPADQALSHNIEKQIANHLELEIAMPIWWDQHCWTFHKGLSQYHLHAIHDKDEPTACSLPSPNSIRQQTLFVALRISHEKLLVHLFVDEVVIVLPKVKCPCGKFSIATQCHPQPLVRFVNHHEGNAELSDGWRKENLDPGKESHENRNNRIKKTILEKIKVSRASSRDVIIKLHGTVQEQWPSNDWIRVKRMNG